MTHAQNPRPADDNTAAAPDDLDAQQLFGRLTATDSPDNTPGPVRTPEPRIDVIPLDESRDANGNWTLNVKPSSAADRARRHLHKLRDSGDIQLPDELLERIALSAVDPKDLEGVTPTRLRTEHGWLLVLDVRLFTPLVNVAFTNDRWVADIVYDADPAADGAGRLHAVPMPTSHSSHAVLVHDLQRDALLNAADQNFRRVLQDNRQDVGRRLIEQPVTLVPTYVGTAESGDNSAELAAVDGNGRVSTGIDEVKILVDWLPGRLHNKHPYCDQPRGHETGITPSLLANLTVTERRTLVRRLAKAATDRLALPAKTPGDRGYAADLRERNRAAITLNCLTVPARIIVGFIDDHRGRYAMTRFASAVRALLVQMNVEGQPLNESARHAISAEEIVIALAEDGVIDGPTCAILVGRAGVTDAMKKLGLDPTLPDLRAALVLQVLCSKDDRIAAVLREKVDNKSQIHASHRSRPAVELAIRSYTASLTPDELRRARSALEKGAIWSDLMRPWEVVNIDSDEAVDLLALYAREQLVDGGPLLRLLGVLGMFALVSTGNLLPAGGSAEQLVGGRTIDRGAAAHVVSAILRHEWGVVLLADAIKRARAGERRLRWIDDHGNLIDAPEDWRGAHFDANLRLAAKRDTVQDPIITGSTKEQIAWTAVAEAVVTAKQKLIDYMELRRENGTVDKLPWVEVESTVTNLTVMSSNIGKLSEAQPLEWS